MVLAKVRDAATRVWARHPLPRPEFANDSGLTCLGVHGKGFNHSCAMDFFANTQKPHQQSPRFYSGKCQYSSAFRSRNLKNPLDALISGQFGANFGTRQDGPQP